MVEKQRNDQSRKKLKSSTDTQIINCTSKNERKIRLYIQNTKYKLFTLHEQHQLCGCVEAFLTKLWSIILSLFFIHYYLSQSLSFPLIPSHALILSHVLTLPFLSLSLSFSQSHSPSLIATFALSIELDHVPYCLLMIWNRAENLSLFFYHYLLSCLSRFYSFSPPPPLPLAKSYYYQELARRKKNG